MIFGLEVLGFKEDTKIYSALLNYKYNVTNNIHKRTSQTRRLEAKYTMNFEIRKPKANSNRSQHLSCSFASEVDDRPTEEESTKRDASPGGTTRAVRPRHATASTLSGSISAVRSPDPQIQPSASNPSPFKYSPTPSSLATPSPLSPLSSPTTFPSFPQIWIKRNR
jgi:hypothetical protein